MREKMNSKILFDEDGWLRLNAEVPKVRFIERSREEENIMSYFLLPSVSIELLTLGR
jgi:hypothetical protein